MKHVLLRGSQDQEFLKVVDDIKERKGTFYRMGFRSYEKKENRKVFGDVLGVVSILCSLIQIDRKVLCLLDSCGRIENIHAF